jgi:hypothetical protein
LFAGKYLGVVGLLSGTGAAMWAYQNEQVTGWKGFVHLGDEYLFRIALAVNDLRTLTAVAIDGTGHVVVREQRWEPNEVTWGDKWYRPYDLYGITDFAVAPDSRGRLHILANAEAGIFDIWQREPGVSMAWTLDHIYGDKILKVLAQRCHDGALAIVLELADGLQLGLFAETPPWVFRGVPGGYSPAALALSGEDRLWMFAVEGGTVYQCGQNAVSDRWSWGVWGPLDGVVVDGVSAATEANGRIAVLGWRAGAGAWITRQAPDSSGSWTPWVPVGEGGGEAGGALPRAEPRRPAGGRGSTCGVSAPLLGEYASALAVAHGPVWCQISIGRIRLKRRT